VATGTGALKKRQRQNTPNRRATTKRVSAWAFTLMATRDAIVIPALLGQFNRARLQAASKLSERLGRIVSTHELGEATFVGGDDD
jgi:hypothetical protein